MTGTPGPELTVRAPDGVPEIVPGCDLPTVLLDVLAEAYGDDALRDGDILVVTSKVVSKAEGRLEAGDREQWIDAETSRPVALRGPLRIVRNRLGLTMAAAGVDASNVEAGSVVLLPLDPDASARALRAAARARLGVTIGVVVTDTAGRAWREGQTDIAIGAAGLEVLSSFAGRRDAHGNELAVTAPAVADEVASAVELAQGKLGGRPCGVLRGRGDLVLPADDDGQGARALVRPDGGDLFGWGAREAVIRAAAGDADDLGPFGAPVSAAELADALTRARLLSPAEAPPTPVDATTVEIAAPRDRHDAVRAVAFAHGWVPTDHPAASSANGTGLRLQRVGYVD